MAPPILPLVPNDITMATTINESFYGPLLLKAQTAVSSTYKVCVCPAFIPL